MQRTLSIRGRFWIAALAVALVSLILALFVPLTYSETKYHGLDVVYWYVPFKNYVLFAAGLGCIVVLLFILGFARHIATYSSAVVLGIAAVALMYMSFLSITIFDEERMYIKDVFTEHSYKWTDMAAITLQYDDIQLTEDYVFTFKDGSSVLIENNRQFDEASNFIYTTARQHDIVYSEERVIK